MSYFQNLTDKHLGNKALEIHLALQRLVPYYEAHLEGSFLTNGLEDFFEINRLGLAINTNVTNIADEYTKRSTYWTTDLFRPTGECPFIQLISSWCQIHFPIEWLSMSINEIIESEIARMRKGA